MKTKDLLNGYIRKVEQQLFPKNISYFIIPIDAILRTTLCIPFTFNIHSSVQFEYF